jgi:hypothetical protein
VGQLSDPYEQGEEELGITISGLPGELDDAPDDAPVDAPVDGDDDVIVFALDEWSDMERSAVTDRLREAGIPHGWEGTSLHVAAADEAPVANVLDIVEGEAAPALDDERDQVAYDLSEWDDDLITTLEGELRAAEISYGWEGELYVYADDEQAVDELFDRVAHPHQLAAEPDDGPAGAELLGELFVAADRLQHDGEDPVGTINALELGRAVDGSDPPYGLGKAEWDHLCERVRALGDELLEDDVDPDAVMASARDLRTALRPYV